MTKIQNSLKLMGLAFVLCAAVPVGSNAKDDHYEECLVTYQICLSQCIETNTCGLCDKNFLECVKASIAAKKKSKK